MVNLENKKLLLLGDETFYKDTTINKLIKNNPYVKYDAEEDEETEILNSLIFRGLLESEERLVIIKNFQNIKNKDFFINNEIKKSLVLDCEELETTFLRKLKTKFECVEFRKPNKTNEKEAFTSFINSFLKTRNFEIEEDAKALLYTLIGYDLYWLYHELSKLLLICDKIIKIKDIEALIKVSSKASIYNVVDNVVKGDKKEAIQQLNNLADSDVFRLIGAFLRSFKNLLYVKETLKSSKEISSFLGIPEFIVLKLRDQMSSITVQNLVKGIGILTNLDYRIREGVFNTRYYIEKFILES